MSLLLDALKKAALEKQRREQLAQGEAVSGAEKSAPSNHENTPEVSIPPVANSTDNTRVTEGVVKETTVKDIESKDVERKEIDVKEIEVKESEVKESDVKEIDAKATAINNSIPEAPLEFDLDAIDDNYRLVMAAEQQTTPVTEEHAELTTPDVELSVTQPEGVLVSDTVISNTVVSSDATSPVDDNALWIDEALIEKSLAEASRSSTLSDSTPTRSPVKKTAQESHAVENRESIPVMTPVQAAASESITTSPVEPIAAAQPIAAKSIAHFNAHSGKDALNQLLSRSSQAAQRARKRMMIIYALLTCTSVTLVGLYYYLLSSGEVSPSMAANNFPSTINNDLTVVDAVSEELMPQDVTPEDEQANANEAGVSATETEQQTDNALITADADTYTPPDTHVNAATASVTDAKKSSLSQSSVSAPKTAVAATNITATQTTAKTKSATTATADAPSVSLPAERPATYAMVSRQAAVDDISESIRRGYEAYQAGDYASAELAYRDALAEDPHQRDALLGAAAVAVQLNRQEEALRFYQQRLARAPKDEYAQAGILALTASSDNNPQFDSELNRLLREFPNAAHLHFLKGSLFAAREQWGAAQLAFFEAWQRDNKNPNYAFNLAVAMDHIQVPKEALHFYQQALLLSTGRQVGFSMAAVQQRVQELEQP